MVKPLYTKGFRDIRAIGLEIGVLGNRANEDEIYMHGAYVEAIEEKLLELRAKVVKLKSALQK